MLSCVATQITFQRAAQAWEGGPTILLLAMHLFQPNTSFGACDSFVFLVDESIKVIPILYLKENVCE